MQTVVIENPVINSPFAEPRRHFRFTEDGISNEIVEARRVSQYFIPIAPPRKKGATQLACDTEWTADRIQENQFINQVHERVSVWRRRGHPGVTKTTARRGKCRGPRVAAHNQVYDRTNDAISLDEIECALILGGIATREDCCGSLPRSVREAPQFTKQWRRMRAATRRCENSHKNQPPHRQYWLYNLMRQHMVLALTCC